MSVSDYVFQSVESHRDAIAVSDALTGDSLTFGEVLRCAETVAGVLRDRGLLPGDVVAVVSPNSIWYPAAFHGILQAGLVLSPISPLYTAQEIAYQLRDSGARAVITVRDGVDRVSDAARETSVAHVLTLDGSASASRDHPRIVIEDAWRRGRAPRERSPMESSIAVLPYSSGTTGSPKGVLLSHHNIVANIAQFEHMINVEPGVDRQLAVLPFFHIYGLTCVLSVGLRTGMATTVMGRFDLESFLRLVQDQAITRACIAPPIVLALAKDPIVSDYNISSLRILLSGAAPLDADLAIACQTRLGSSVRVLQGYGMTELSPLSHMSPDPGCEPPDRTQAPFGSIGYAAPNTECRIVDLTTGVDVGAGTPGELWVRGPQVMRGYLNRPEANVATLTDDGWLRTGDVAVVTKSGLYSIVDRVKELIKYKGYQVPPAELEAVLLKHENVRDAAVIGVPGGPDGEFPVAFVVLRDGAETTDGQLMAYVAEKVAPYKRLRRVYFTGSIPKSPSGKILRRLLRDKADREEVAP
jgi:acyl-CoA synthetase (AMP-forming)/AMP-acid ligase II